MKRKRIAQAGSFSLQLVLCSVAICSLITGTLLAFFHPGAPAKGSHPAVAGLTFAERVAYQRAIEEVYWRHRIWPASNAGAKPPLDKVMSQTEIEKKVENFMRASQALEDYWQRPITSDQLQAEMERIASHTKQPEVLRQLFEALGNDPFVIAECLVRPVLAERLLTELYAHDQRFHSKLKQRAEAELRTHPSVSQMKQTSGMYTEMEWIGSDSADVTPKDAPGVVVTPPRGVPRNVPHARGYSEPDGAPNAIRMNGSEWQGSVAQLAAHFHSQNTVEQARPLPNGWSAAGAAALPKPQTPEIKTGVLSPLQEDDAHYYAVAVMKKGKDRLKLATVAWLKEPLRLWLAKAEAQLPVTMAAVSANYVLPVIAGPSGGCADDTWTPTSVTNAAAARRWHTAVWTGSEMIVWGGYGSNGTNINTGGRYNPSTDSWTATSTASAPAARNRHTAVWTGSEMIVWGGYIPGTGDSNTGGRYSPGTDSWTATNTTNAPDAREVPTAVWTGSEMIVWGGSGNSARLNTGGRYDPSADSWTATSLTNAPDARYGHTAVWTGSEMILWGGHADSGYLNTGGRYSPSTDSWTATNVVGAPVGRQNHMAVWTSSEMIVWGGDNFNNYFNTGGRYNPSTDSWTVTNIIGAPAARDAETAVWTGSEMILWGGYDGNAWLNTGSRYNPSTDSWTATSLTNAPQGRGVHTAVWTGTEMIVWGGTGSSGYLNTGGRYCAQPAVPCTDDTWTSTSITNAPDGRSDHKAVWTGSEMIVWGGVDKSGVLNTGGKYDPSTDSWTATSTTSAPSARQLHTAVWTGSEMIVWGGYDFAHHLNTGGRYNPSTDSWGATGLTNVPAGRQAHTAVWSGSEMIVWGGNFVDGSGGHDLNTGGRYNPSTDSWAATSITNAPIARSSHTAVWTGTQMIVWGGGDLNTGGRYDPAADGWTVTSTINAPTARQLHTAVWSGSEMIVWGGFDGIQSFNTGGRYNPGTDSWAATSITNAPSARFFHTAVWSGVEMIVWGGGADVNSGGRYNSSMDTWTNTSTIGAPDGRDSHTAVWSGTEMIVWGGFMPGNPLNTGGRYCAQSGPTPTPTPTATSIPCHVTSSACGSVITGTAPTDFIVNVSDPVDPATLQPTDFTVNGTPANSYDTINFIIIVFHFNTSPVVQGLNTMQIPAGAFNCFNGPVQEFNCTFTYQPSTPTPTPTATSTATAAATATVTPTPSSIATATPTSTPTPTATPTSTARPSPTPRPTLTPRLRPTPPPRP